MRGLFALLSVFLVLAAPAIAKDCPSDIGMTVEQAKAALGTAQDAPLTDQDRAALACLAGAVGTLNSKLNNLIAGKIEFTGPVISQKGFINQGDAPATEEAR
ncbi:MAG: hypothetical protein NW215_13135 [Hyphomicrobiales bacterium]|nr:hypothetical protein [Hyphomicrobiales bacterium]